MEDGVVIPNYICYEMEEDDSSCNPELGPVDELDPDFIINHYARISGYKPFRMDKEAANVLRSYLDSRFEETVSIKKATKLTMDEFTEKVKKSFNNKNFKIFDLSFQFRLCFMLLLVSLQMTSSVLTLENKGLLYQISRMKGFAKLLIFFTMILLKTGQEMCQKLTTNLNLSKIQK